MSVAQSLPILKWTEEPGSSPLHTESHRDRKDTSVLGPASLELSTPCSLVVLDLDGKVLGGE